MSRQSRDQGYGNGSGNVTRKVKQGPVEIDFEDSALVVHYEMETVSCEFVPLFSSFYHLLLQ